MTEERLKEIDKLVHQAFYPWAFDQDFIEKIQKILPELLREAYLAQKLKAKPWCSTCGVEIYCTKCRQWWDENTPPSS